MPDYAEVAGVTSAYANGIGHQSHTSTSPLYDSCGAYATTSLIGTTNIYHQNANNSRGYEGDQQQQHYTNGAVIRNGPFVYPNKKNSCTSLNASSKMLLDSSSENATPEKQSNTFNGNRNNTLSYGIRNRLMKMNITENKLDILINTNGSGGGGSTKSLNGSCKSIQKPTAETVHPIPPPTPNLGSTRRNQFLTNNNNNGSSVGHSLAMLKQKKRDLFPNEAPQLPVVMKSYLDPETDEEDQDQNEQDGEDQLMLNLGGGDGHGLDSCDRILTGNGVNSSAMNSGNNNNNSSRSAKKSPRIQLMAGDNHNQSSLTGGGSLRSNNNNIINNNINNGKSLGPSPPTPPPYHNMINHQHRRTPGQQPPTTGDLSTTSVNHSTNSGGGDNGGCTSSPAPLLTKKNFTGSDNQINGSPNYMKSFGKTDNV